LFFPFPFSFSLDLPFLPSLFIIVSPILS
jgi:hypothetical protein